MGRLTEDDVLMVTPRGRDGCDEELEGVKIVNRGPDDQRGIKIRED